MKSIELFAGIGGISLAAEWAGIETVAFCERDTFCQKVLNKHWPDVPIFDDVCTLNRKMLEEKGVIEPGGTIDIISGGFPCQPFSVAGKRKGKDDDRDLWHEMFRLIQELQPTWVVGENVANFVNMELERSLVDLEREGYETQAFLIPATGVGANHKRERCFILAYRKGKQSSSTYEREFSKKEQKQFRGGTIKGIPRPTWEIRESPICGVADGLPNRLDRHRSLGNAVVPQQIYPIFEAIMKEKSHGQSN
jgi:DNA (cytosine-5)-methyltransferase 1